MKYNFDKIVNRKETDCVKWDSKKEYNLYDVIPMWIGDMDFKCPDPVVEAIRKRAEHPVFGYANLTDEFNEVTANWMKRRHNLNIENNWVRFSPGVVPAISAFIQCFTKEGDNVLIQKPVYYPFINTIEECNRKVISSSLIIKNGRYEIDFEDLESKASRENVKAMIICNPHNPVGRMYSKEELQKIADICIKHNIIVFSDEIHCDYTFGGKYTPFSSLSREIANRSITAIAPSKTFNIAGLQAAAIISPNMELLSKMERHFIKNTQHHISDFGLVGYKAAYTECDDYADSLIKYIGENISIFTNYIKENVSKIKILKHEATYFVWLDCREFNMTNEELDKFFIENIKLALDSGYKFGCEGEGFMRINLACPRSIVFEALKRIENAVKLL